MYCSECGTKISNSARFCLNCGSPIGTSPTSMKSGQQDLSHGQLTQTEKPTPIALIATAWILVVLQFVFPMGQLSIIIDIAVLICTILLIASKNAIGKLNGWILIAIWLIDFLRAFFNARSGQF